MIDPPRKDDTPSTSMASVARYLGLAFVIPISAGAGWAIGAYLDTSFHTGFLAMTCLILAIAGAFTHLIRELLRDANKQ